MVVNGFHFSFFSVVVALALFAFALTVIAILLVLAKKKETDAFKLRYVLEQVYEVLFVSPDGYCSWLYGMEKNSKPKEVVSHKLAVLLNLKNGINSNFNDVLDRINQDDKETFIEKVNNLKNKGENFACEIKNQEKNKRIIAIGYRSQNSVKVLADTVWFRDITSTSDSMDELYSLNKHINKKYEFAKNVIDKIPFPVWGRDKNLKITFCNQVYAEAVGAKNEDEVVENKIELASGKVLLKSRNLAIDAYRKKNKQVAKEHLVIKGNRHYVSIAEQYTPIEEGDFKCATLGMAFPIDDEGELDSKLKRHISAHFGVLENLTTAIVIFDADKKLSFYNKPFVNLFGFASTWLDEAPFYPEFLDALREKRMLPESRDFKAYKSSELELFGSLLEPCESLLYLPMGKILRRFMIPYGLGGLLISYEDVTDRKALEASYETSISTQRATIDNIREAVAMFDAEENLNLYNSNYLKLWKFEKSFLDTRPKFSEIIEMHRPFFTEDETEWNSFKGKILDTLSMGKEAKLRFERRDNKVLDVSKVPLVDGGFLLAFDDITREAYEREQQEQQIQIMSKKDKTLKDFIDSMASGFTQPLKELSDFAGKLPSSALFVEKASDIENTFLDVMRFAKSEINASMPVVSSVDIPLMLEDIMAKLKARADAKLIYVSINYDKKNSIKCLTDRERIFELLYYITATSLGIARKGENVSINVKKETKKEKSYVKVTFSPHFIPSDVKNAVQEYLGIGNDLVKMNVNDLSCSIEVERTVELTSLCLIIPAETNQADNTDKNDNK